MKQPKAEATANKILDAALALFEEKGFDATTMREIAERAGVATGGAYYYFASKEAIVMHFYQRSVEDMEEKIVALLGNPGSFEDGLSGLIGIKLMQFGPHREVLRALLRNGADPSYPLSPFSAETKQIRELDISWFQGLIKQSKIRVPRDLAPHLPGILWFFQMGLILFWVTDLSSQQARTERLMPIACKIVTSLVRFSALPLMRPLRKPVIELIHLVGGNGNE